MSQAALDETRPGCLSSSSYHFTGCFTSQPVVCNASNCAFSSCCNPTRDDRVLSRSSGPSRVSVACSTLFGNQRSESPPDSTPLSGAGWVAIHCQLSSSGAKVSSVTAKETVEKMSLNKGQHGLNWDLDRTRSRGELVAPKARRAWMSPGRAPPTPHARSVSECGGGVGGMDGRLMLLQVRAAAETPAGRGQLMGATALRWHCKAQPGLP